MDRDAIKRLTENCGRYFRRKAERIVKSSKGFKPGYTFKTGIGRKNCIAATDSDTVYIRSISTGKDFNISKSTLQRVIAYYYQVRIVERKELEVFSERNSSLFGLLAAIFKHESRLFRIRNLLRLVRKAIRMVLAGADRCPRDLEIAKKAGCKYVLFSYYHIRYRQAWKRYLEKFGLRCILDCGKFSEWQAKLKGRAVEPLVLEDYIAFINENAKYIDHYFVMDEIGDWKGTMKNLQRMEETGLAPIPIFHMGTVFEVLDMLVTKGYPVIGLGGTVNQPGREQFFANVFNRHPGMAFHGLGVSNVHLLAKYPFFSADSSAWIQARKKDVILTCYGQVKNAAVDWAERMKLSLIFWKSLESVKVFERYFKATGPVQLSLF